MAAAQDTPEAVTGCPAPRTSEVQPFWNKTQKPTRVGKVILHCKMMYRLWCTCSLEKEGSTTKITIWMTLPSIAYESPLQVIQAVTDCKEVWLLTTQTGCSRCFDRAQGAGYQQSRFSKKGENGSLLAPCLTTQLMTTQHSYWYDSLPFSTLAPAIP